MAAEPQPASASPSLASSSSSSSASAASSSPVTSSPTATAAMTIPSGSSSSLQDHQHPFIKSWSCMMTVDPIEDVAFTDGLSYSSLDSLDLKSSGEWSSDDKPSLKAVKRSLWQRIGKKVSSVGKGLLTDHTAKLLLQEHWLEAADPRHRYGTLLQSYHDIWKRSDSTENFFYWLDQGEGSHIDLSASPRKKLETSALQYLEPSERFQYLVSVSNGRLIYEATGQLVHTHTEGQKPSKWIFVVDPKGRLFVAKKVKGRFHHSSFLAGGPAKAAGNLTVDNGVLTRVSRSSGHYRPSEDDLTSFLQLLASRGVNTSQVLIEDFD